VTSKEVACETRAAELAQVATGRLAIEAVFARQFDVVLWTCRCPTSMASTRLDAFA
jgi:hypothetical protein